MPNEQWTQVELNSEHVIGGEENFGAKFYESENDQALIAFSWFSMLLFVKFDESENDQPLLKFYWFLMLLFYFIAGFGITSPKKARPHFDDALCHVCIVIPTSHVVIMR